MSGGYFFSEIPVFCRIESGIMKRFLFIPMHNSQSQQKQKYLSLYAQTNETSLVHARKHSSALDRKAILTHDTSWSGPSLRHCTK